MKREEAKNLLYDEHGEVYELIDRIADDSEAQLKAKDEEIKRVKEVINTSIEEIEYAIIKPQYARDYLGNAIRLLKELK